MTRTLTAAILAATIGLAPAAQADRLLYRLPDGTQTYPQQGYSQQGGNQAAQILGGLAILGAFGYALNKMNDDDDDDDRRRVYRRGDDRRGWDRGGWEDRRYRRSAGGLPSSCYRSLRGGGTVVGTDCLYRRGVNVSRLPRGCGTRVIAGGRERRAFDARCLRHNGWGVARHR